MRKRLTKIVLKIFILTLIILLIVLYSLRYSNSTELDDVSPGISCERDLIEKADTLWIIPVFEGKAISSNEEWCKEILALNKTLGLHGVYHDYNEFGTTREGGYIDRGIKEFESCFGYKPEMFKAPQLNLTKENKRIVEEAGMRVRGKLSQVTHKVYHCEDRGTFSNRFIDLF